MKKSDNSYLLHMLEEEAQFQVDQKKLIESGEEIKCPDCDGSGTIGLKFIYDRSQLGYRENSDGPGSSHEKEVECNRCKGLGQFDPGKDKLTQEIKGLIAENT